MGACSQTKSEHTRRQVAAIRRDDTSQRQIVSCVWRNVCENLCLRNRILSLQQVAKKSNQTEFVRLVVATKILLQRQSFLQKFSNLQEAICRCCNLSPSMHRPLPDNSPTPPLIGALLVINLCWVLAKRRG